MTAVTVYAVASAKEGFEDYLGFHAVLPAARSEANGTSGKNDSETDPFPLAAAR
jgi:hypothetical protein